MRAVKEHPPPIGDRASTSDADDRDRNADDRDDRAEAHDLESENRDERGAARDRRAETRDRANESFDADAAADRAAASRDRKGAASDRMQAADDRDAAAGDRVVSAKERALSSMDDLTGAYRRDAGTKELEREVSRAKRNKRSLVLAFVDVDGLKTTNDAHGHAAGDALLQRTVGEMRAQLRPYDLIVRFGGDEFVCALPDLDVRAAADRFQAIGSALREAGSGSITVGLTEMSAEDSLEELIERADAALYRERTKRKARFQA
jgi:diguanylate cyclase (GGDEF)-like protein